MQEKSYFFYFSCKILSIVLIFRSEMAVLFTLIIAEKKIRYLRKIY